MLLQLKQTVRNLISSQKARIRTPASAAIGYITDVQPLGIAPPLRLQGRIVSNAPVLCC